MTPRLLSRDELQALAERVDFSRAGQSVVTTCDVLPIDVALGDALGSWPSWREACPAWESLEWQGVLTLPAAPKELQDRLPAIHRQERRLPLHFFIQGVEACGATLLFVENFTSRSHRALWGVDQERLVFGRSLDLDVVSSLAHLPQTLERAALDQAAASAPQAGPSLRM